MRTPREVQQISVRCLAGSLDDVGWLEVAWIRSLMIWIWLMKPPPSAWGSNVMQDFSRLGPPIVGSRQKACA